MITLKKIKENYLLVSILILATILRFYHIDFQSVWLDEIHTLNEANPNVAFTEVYDLIVKGEQMPPLYFYTVYFLFKIFGYFTIVVRLYSAILGVLSIYSIYLLGKELVNKKAGILAALLLSVNYFHLCYSQESRPYILLVLFTTLSFYSLVKFLKQPNKKNAILYGIIGALMIYAHFFGLFTLFTQYLLLLFFLLLTDKKDKKAFFINAFISGIVTLVLFIPAIKTFIKVTQIKEFWIQRPTLDVFTNIFKEFFGGSELILPLLIIIFILYFVKLSKEENSKISYQYIVNNKTVLSFIILASWITLGLLIPLIRTYLSVPMLISRYFISLLPAIILLMAIGICEIKNRMINIVFISIFVIFSLTDILIIKDYYNTVLKTQFRESTNFIKVNNKNNEPIVSSLGWYMTYFFQNKKVIDKSLENYLNEMKEDSTKTKPFWYIDGHVRPYKLSEETQKFVDSKFYIDNNYDGYDTWAKHFILLKDVPKTIDISKFKKLEQNNGDVFKNNVEVFENANNVVKTSGWAFFENIDATKTIIDVVLIKDGVAIRLFTQKAMRPDIVTYFKSKVDLSNTGFTSIFNISGLESGKYQLGLYLKNKELNKEGLFLTDKFVNK